MRSANVIYSLCIVLLIIVVAIIKWRFYDHHQKELFNRHTTIIYTDYALCVMQCRNITKNDINFLMQHGVINLSRSNNKNTSCPTYALQGYTHKGDYLRVLFEQCFSKTLLLTCYNLKKETVCNCTKNKTY